MRKRCDGQQEEWTQHNKSSFSPRLLCAFHKVVSVSKSSDHIKGKATPRCRKLAVNGREDNGQDINQLLQLVGAGREDLLQRILQSFVHGQWMVQRASDKVVHWISQALHCHAMSYILDDLLVSIFAIPVNACDWRCQKAFAQHFSQLQCIHSLFRPLLFG